MIPRHRTALALLPLLLLLVSAAAGRWAECGAMREMHGFHAHGMAMRVDGHARRAPLHPCPPPRMPDCPLSGGPGGWLAALASPPTAPAWATSSASARFPAPDEAPDLLIARGPFHPPRA